MERQLTDFPRIQLSKVKEELKREQQARVAAELKATASGERNFEMYQEVNKLKAMTDRIQTKQLEQAATIVTLKDNIKNAQEHLVDCFLKQYMTKENAEYYACVITRDWETAKKLKELAAAKEEALK